MIKSIKNSIPNLFTLANLTCGILGIIYLFDGKLESAAYLIWIAAVLDFLDGFIAKLLNAQSEIGKQLDSLADLVTFGVLPSLIYFDLLKDQFDLPMEYLSIVVALFSALRLAKFNIDDSQKSSFRGVPTPANAILTSSFPLILGGTTLLSQTIDQPYWLLGIMLLSSILMVAPITLISLKFSDVSIKGNLDRILLILGSVILGILFHESAIPLVIAFYIIISQFGKNKAV